MKTRLVGILTGIGLVFLVVFGLMFNNGSVPMANAAEIQQAQAKVTVDEGGITTDWCNYQLSREYPNQPYPSASDNKVHSTLVDVNDDKGNLQYKTPVFDIGAMHPVGSGYPSRLWSDAVNYPLTTKTLTGVETVVCHDPLQAAIIANRIAAAKIDGVTVGSLNPWIHTEGLDGDIKNATTWARHCWTQDLDVHQHCFQTMAAIVQLLEAFHDEGVHKTSSDWMVDCAAFCVTSNHTVPTMKVVTDKHGQDTGYFIVITLTSKTSNGCFLKLGFNVGANTENGGDQRMAGLPCSHSKPPSSPSSHKTSKTPVPHHGKTTSPTPKPSTSTSHAPSSSPTPSKTPSSSTPPTTPPTTTSPTPSPSESTSASPTPSESTSPTPTPSESTSSSPTPTPSLTTTCPPTSTSPTPKPSPSKTTHTPSPKPSRTTHSPSPKPSKTTTPPKTCESVYGPGYSGEYPNCHKDGSPTGQPTQRTSAPGKNPDPDPTDPAGSNQCYDDQTGKPVKCP